MQRSDANRTHPLIMIVDTAIADVDVIRRAFATAEHDFEMTAAHTNAEACAHLEIMTPDLVITNFRLADGKITELMRAIRHCPVIVLSDSNDAVDATEAMRNGAADFIVKSTAALLNLPLIATGVMSEWRPTEDAEHKQRVDDRLETGHRWQSVGQLTQGMADRLSDVLRPLARECEAARDDVSRESEAYWHLTSAIKAARQSQDLAEHLVSVTAKGDQQMRPVRIETLFRDTMRMIKASAPPSIAIRHSIFECDCLVDADASQLRHLIYSICIDAFHALSSGGLIEISVSLADLTIASEIGAGKGDYVRLTFQDSRSRAILPSPRSSEPFFMSMSRCGDVSLDVASRIAETHGGAITCEAVDTGNAVHVYLPII